jgi:hypothetical protein
MAPESRGEEPMQGPPGRAAASPAESGIAVRSRTDGGGSGEGRRSEAGRFALFTVLATLFVLANLIGHARDPLGVDEIFSLRASSMPWRALWTWIAKVDSHPPLFYGLLKLWTAIGGDSVVWLRLLPAVTALAGLLALWGLANELRLRSGELLVLLVLASMSPLLQLYALEVRMFALLQTASVLSLWAFLRWLESPAPSRATTGSLFVANAILVYAHLWGWLFVGCEAAYVVASARPKLPAFARHLGLVAVLVAPWIVAVVTSGRESYTGQIEWMVQPGASAPVTFYVSVIGGFPFPHSGVIVGAALAGLLGALCVRATRLGERAPAVWFLTWFAVLPVAATFVAALVLRVPVWAPRSLVVSAVPFLALVTVAAHQLKGRWSGAATWALTLWAIGAGVSWTVLPHRLDWNHVTARMARAVAPESERVPVYTLEPFVWDALSFHVPKHAALGAFDVERIEPAALARVDAERLLVVYRDPPDRRYPLTVNPERLLAERGYLATRGAPITHESTMLWVLSARRSGAAVSPASASSPPAGGSAR